MTFEENNFADLGTFSFVMVLSFYFSSFPEKTHQLRTYHAESSVKVIYCFVTNDKVGFWRNICEFTFRTNAGFSFFYNTTMRMCEMCDDDRYYTVCQDCDADCCEDCIGECKQCGRTGICDDYCTRKGKDCRLCTSANGCSSCMVQCEECERSFHKLCMEIHEITFLKCKVCGDPGCSDCFEESRDVCAECSEAFSSDTE